MESSTAPTSKNKQCQATRIPDDEGWGRPVVKVPDYGRHVMSSSSVLLKTCRVGQRCTLTLQAISTENSVIRLWRREEDCLAISADCLESLQFMRGFGSGLRVADIHTGILMTTPSSALGEQVN
ncbi:hypothetical protein TNCV_941801 [Trichonephila clavipes]|nr:hypothetical protein TNCV_941801 [Trichonephila clavipes]